MVSERIPNLIGQMSSFKFLFFGWLFASQKKREMHSISRPEFALQTRAFQGSVRTSCYLHSFATLRNWLRQPLQSLPRFVNQILEIEPNTQKFRSVPGSCYKLAHQWKFSLHEPRVFFNALLKTRGEFRANAL